MDSNVSDFDAVFSTFCALRFTDCLWYNRSTFHGIEWRSIDLNIYPSHLNTALKRLMGSGLLLVVLLVTTGFSPSHQVVQLSPVTAANGQLLINNMPFEVRGVNYIHTSNADLSRCADLHFGADGNCPWDIAVIGSDMDRLHALGINTVRVFLNYYVFGGARAADPNYSMDEPLQHLDAFIESASMRGIYVLPVLMAKYPQDRFGPENYETALDLHLRPVVAHLVGRTGVLGWDVFNEPDIGSPVDIRCWDWANAAFPLCFPLANERLHFLQTMIDAVRGIDPQHLVTVSVAFAKSYFQPSGTDLRLADRVDFFAFHYYDNDPYDCGRYAAHWYYGQGFPADLNRAVSELHALGLNKPIVITELGFPSGDGTARTTDELRRDLRRSLEAARADITSGMVLWPFQPQPEDLVGNLYTSS